MLKSRSPIKRASWSLALKSAAVSGGEGGRIECRGLANRSYELPSSIHQKRAARIAIVEEALKRLRDGAEVVFREGPARCTNRHVAYLFE